MNKIGKMHQVKKWRWLLFPGEALADIARWVAAPGRTHVTAISPNDLVVLLEVDGKFKKILSSNGEMGWICCGEDYNNCFEEVSQ